MILAIVGVFLLCYSAILFYLAFSKKWRGQETSLTILVAAVILIGLGIYFS